MIPVQEAPTIKFEPTFNIMESTTNGLGDKKLGQRIRAIIDYQVIEKTKTYTVLRVNGFFLKSSARAF